MFLKAHWKEMQREDFFLRWLMKATRVVVLARMRRVAMHHSSGLSVVIIITFLNIVILTNIVVIMTCSYKVVVDSSVNTIANLTASSC